MEHNHKGTMEGTQGRETLFGIYEMTPAINGAEHNKSGNGVRERSGCESRIRRAVRLVDSWITMYLTRPEDAEHDAFGQGPS